MTAKTKYRLTPFHFVSLWFLYETIVEFGINAKLGDTAELGALFPFIYLGLFLGTLLLDFVIQLIISAGFKGDWKVLYLIQILIIVLIGVLMMQTVHYAD
jgi:hypothetical protein